MACEPQYETKSIIVQGYDQRGIITDTRLINTCPSPTVYPNYNGQRCDDPSVGFNWYTSCLPFGIGPNRIETTSLSSVNAVHVAGPSLGEGQQIPGNYIYIVGYTGSADAASQLNLPYLPNITQGCNINDDALGKSGPITGISVSGGQSNPEVGIYYLSAQPQSTNGTGAILEVADNGRTVTINDGGSGYKVGDTFTVVLTGGFSPRPPYDGATITVTSIGGSSSSINGPTPINWWIVDPRMIGNPFDGPGNFLYRTDGYAIGDIFEFKVPGEDSKNTNARIEVTAIEPTNVQESEATLQYTVEKNVDLIFNITSNNRTVNLVRDYDASSTTDQVLQESASEVFRIWFQYFSRPPTDVEFEYYTQQFYANGGQISPEISEQILDQFAYELDNNVIQIRGECEGQEGEDEFELADGTSCVWNRNDFYQGAGTSAGRNVQLKDLWDFLGQPNGPSGPGGGASVEDIVCPKPESGQIADLEPDLSDFAGMQLWRWLPCTDGSNGGDPNLGGYQEIIVPCPGPQENCTNPTTEDDLAVYNQSAKITWNNGEYKTGNFVISTKNAQAQAINNKYLTLLARPAAQDGLAYWNDIANQVFDGVEAVYWANGYVEWQNGTSSVTPLVKTPKNANATAINNKYLEVLGRPADIAGMGLWANEADSIGITNTLRNIEIAAENELLRGPIVKLQFGLDRALQLIEDVASAPGGELSRGGVDSYKLFCETQVSAEIDLSYFINTRIPPKYGTITIGSPEISVAQIADSIYFGWKPANQTEEVFGFADSNAIDTVTPYKTSFDNRFTINWPSLQGDIGNQTPPIYVKYVRCVLYQVKDGSGGPLSVTGGVGGTPAVEFIDYTDDRLEAIVGPRNIDELGTFVPGTGYTQPWGGALGGNSALNDLQPRMAYLPAFGDSITDDEAKAICFDEDPHKGRKFYWRVQAKTYVLDPDTLQPIPGLTKTDTFSSATDTQTMRYFSAWGTGPGPVGGPTGGPVGGGSTCNNLSITCGQNAELNVETGQTTKIAFSYRVNNASGCNTKGSARVSIRRYWPCPVFGPPSGAENQWVVQKQPVSISNGEALYELTVNTTKSDYLATSYEDQTVEDPGNCHWVYVAYWEILGMDGTSIDCNYSAWDNPGCNYQTVFNFLDEILCTQKQNCDRANDRKQILGGNAGTVQTGPFTALEMINPYPDPSKVRTLSQFDNNRPEEPNPATPNGDNWNWYYDCLPSEQTASDGSVVPGEQYKFRVITGSGRGGYVSRDFVYYTGFTTGPDGKEDFTKGCVDNDGDFVQFYVDGISPGRNPDGVLDGGTGFAVGDILEYYAVDQDPDTVPARFRVTAIDTSKAERRLNCSQAPWANEFSQAEMDPTQNCLPYCSTSGKQTFYWNDQIGGPQPGVNCSDGTISNDPATCTDDCPVCEQTVKVTVGDTTSCGALGFPALREGGGPGINNGRVLVGDTFIDNPNTLPPTIDRTRAEVYTRQLDNKKVVPITVENWVSVAPAKVGTLTTLGKDNAIDFDEVDNQALYDECCVNDALTFDCIALRNSGFCQQFEAGEISTTQEIDCNAQMRVVAQWYYKVEYKNNGVITETGLLPLPFWTNYDTPDEEQIFNIPTDYYPESAGNGTNGVAMTYRQETPDGSYYNGFDTAYLPADDNVNKLSVYLQIRASNDQWGDPKFDNPPPGFNAGDFGTDNDVSSPRPPHNIGTQGPGPKPDIFLIGEFKLGETANLPQALDWNMTINGCSDAQVYDQKPASGQSEFTCGDTTSDNYYIGRTGYSNSAEFGKANGEEFFRDIYINGSACAGDVPNFDPKDGSGSKLKPIYCPTLYLPSFTDCCPYSDVRLNVGGIGGVDWGDYNVGGCTTGIKLIWYVNGIVRSKGFISGPTGDGGEFVCYNYASCGDIWEDLSQWMNDSTATYTVTVYAVVNNIDDVAWKNVNRDWSTQNGDPYNFTGGDQRKWKVLRGSNRQPAQIVNAGGVDGEPIVIPPNARWNEGDVFQVILGTATCTVKGNNGSTGKDLTGLQRPDFTITSSGETWQDLGGFEDFEGAVIDCNPPCCDNGNTGNQCAELIGTQIGTLCGPLLCAGTNNAGGKLTATPQNLPEAWPRLPGQTTRVEGTVKYFWEFKNNANSWVPVEGGTGDVISYIADGRQYRCTVTYDLAGNVPQGYTAKPEKTSKTIIYTVDDVPTEECPDGTIVPIGNPCPGDPGNCDQPERVTGNTPPVFLPSCSNVVGGGFCTQITVANGNPVQVSYLPTFDNFNNVQWVANGTYGVLEFNNIEIQSSRSALSTFTQGQPTLSFAGSGTVSASNVTRSYTAKFVIKYKCQPSDTQVKTTTVRIANAVSITWNTNGGDPDNDYPKLVDPPTCFYSSGYLNSSGCGSYLGRWQNELGGPFLYYFHTVKNDVNPDNRGVQYSASAVASNASCAFCPSTACPTLQVNSVTVNPNAPQVNDSITLQVNYNWNANGFTEITNPFLNNGLFTQITWALPDGTSQTGDNAQITVGPYTSEGQRTFTVTVAKFYDDPQQECADGGGFIVISGIATDTYEFTIDVGGDGPVDPDPDAEDPEFFNVSITGPSELTLVNGTVTGTWEVDYQLSDGVGYIPNTRPVVAKWDGDSSGNFAPDGLTYTRTFSSPSGANGINIPVELNKLFCPQDVGADRCIQDNILNGNPPLSNAEKKWVVSDPVSKNVVIKGEDVGNQEPTIRTRVTANKTSGVAPVTITFTSTTQVDDGDWVRTPEPAALRYNVVDRNYSTGTVNRNATLTQTWTETFTEAFSGTIGARYRRNYCPPGTPSDSNCVGKKGFLDNDHVSINITNPGPVGTKPTATINQNIAYTPQEVDGCGFAVNDVVEATITIDLTQGTGDYIWDDVETTTGNWVRNGQKLQQTVSRVRVDEYNFNLGTIVIFKKNGQEVHRDASGTASVCINIIGGITPF